jgi:ABC-2 type transport system ATP-binding protein
LIELTNVGHTYRAWLGGNVRAVDGFTLSVNRGEVVGLAGPNGAGKSTLIGLLLGYMRPTDGIVTIDGRAPRAFIEHEGIGYLSELIALPQRWRVDETLHRLALLAGVPPARIAERRDAVVSRLGLGEHRRKRIKQLSKGNLQRVGLGQALLHDERVMIFDEPTHGLDPLWTQRFRDLVRELRHPDRAIFIASHNLDELERVADRVAIIDRGRLQRVVETRAAVGEALQVYRVVVARGEASVAAAFPGAVAAGVMTFDLPAATIESVNASVARFVADGGLIASLAPAHSALERQFREAVAQ